MMGFFGTDCKGCCRRRCRTGAYNGQAGRQAAEAEAKRAADVVAAAEAERQRAALVCVWGARGLLAW